MLEAINTSAFTDAKIETIINMTKLNRLNLPYGAIKRISSELSISRDTVSDYINGKFDEHSKCYNKAIETRERIKLMYNLN